MRQKAHKLLQVSHGAHTGTNQTPFECGSRLLQGADMLFMALQGVFTTDKPIQGKALSCMYLEGT